MGFRLYLSAPLILTAALCGGAQAQIIIPTPIDPVEPVIMEPDIEPPLRAPGSAPPPASSAPMSSAEAKAEAKAVGGALRDAYRDLPLAPGAAGQIPHYREALPAEAAFFEDADAMAGAGFAAGRSNEGYQTANDPNRPVVPVSRADIARAAAIEDDPQNFLDGEQLGGANGSLSLIHI